MGAASMTSGLHGQLARCVHGQEVALNHATIDQFSRTDGYALVIEGCAASGSRNKGYLLSAALPFELDLYFFPAFFFISFPAGDFK